MPAVRKTPKTYNSYQLARRAAEAALSKKAQDVIILDLKNLTTVTDYFVICSGEVDVHVEAIMDEIHKVLKKDIKPWHIEGNQYLHWVLMDYVDFVVHVFQKETRDYYDIERLWADAPLEKISLPEGK
jgi:ribosome-associated protein